MDQQLIEKAKAWARERGVSLSETVAGFFAQLPRPTPPTNVGDFGDATTLAVLPEALQID